MSTELESVAEFLTGNRMGAPSLPWQTLRSEDVRVLRDWAGETLPFPVQRRLMRDLRRALRTPNEAGDEIARAEVAPALLRALRRSPLPARLAGRQAKLLLDVCETDESLEGARDAAVIALMLYAGLRRREVVGLQRGDYEDEDGRIKISSRRGLARSVILEGRTRAAVEGWLRLRGAWSGPLIAALTPQGEVLMRGLTPSAVNRLLARRCDQSGCAGITPRDLRSRFLRDLQTVSRARPLCRYYQDENGQPAWVLASMTTTE